MRCITVLLLLFSYFVVNGQTLYERYEATIDASNAISNLEQRAQSFTIGTTGSNVAHTVTSVQIFGWRVTTATSLLKAEIFAVDGSGFPTGTAISTSGYISTAAWATDANGAWHSITMSACVLASSTKYILVITVGDANSIRWGLKTSSTYTGGTFITSSDGGANWAVSSTLDADFRIYGTEVITARNRVVWFNYSPFISNNVPDPDPEPEEDYNYTELSGKVLYVDISGNSGNDGLTVSTPVTVNDVVSKLDNTFDYVALSDTDHYGSVEINSIVKTSDYLTITTWNKYNHNRNAEIKGLTSVGSWSQSGSVWSKSGLSLPANPQTVYADVYFYSNFHLNGIYINNAWYDISKYPDSKTYLSIESGNNSNTLVDNSGIATNDYWNGATLISENPTWVNSKFTVTDYASGGTFYVTSMGDQVLSSPAGMKYHLINHSNAANNDGEWWVDYASGNLRVYYGADLNAQSVYVPLQDYCLTVSASQNIRIKGLSFSGANKLQANVINSTNTIIDSCDFYRAPVSAVGLYNCAASKVRYCNMYYPNDNGITAFANNGTEYSHNYIRGAGVSGTIGGGRDGRHLNGIVSEHDEGDITAFGNIIDSTGYCGIQLAAGSAPISIVCNNNWVNNAMMIVSDGAALYTYWHPYNVPKYFCNNLITNTFNNTAFHRLGATNFNATESRAIYIDEGYGEGAAGVNRNYIIEDNTIFNYPQGFFQNGDTRRLSFRNNVLANNKQYSAYAGNAYYYKHGGTYPDSVFFTKNTIINGPGESSHLMYLPNYNEWDSPTDERANYIDSNTYIDPYGSSGYVWLVASGSPEWSFTQRDLTYARSIFTDWEDHSSLNQTWQYDDVTGITTTQFTWLFSNQSATPHSFNLGSASFYDLDHNAVSGILTLDPYESKVLFYHMGSLTGLTNPSIYR